MIYHQPILPIRSKMSGVLLFTLIFCLGSGIIRANDCMPQAVSAGIKKKEFKKYVMIQQRFSAFLSALTEYTPFAGIMLVAWDK